MDNVSSIVAATDLSEGSSLALRTAEVLALRLQAELTVVHVYRATVLDELKTVAPDVDAAQRVGAQARAELDVQLKAELARPEAARVTLRHDEDPARALVDCSRERGASLLVCGLRERSPVTRALTRRVAEATSQLAACPVLVVPSAAGVLPESPRRIVALATRDQEDVVTCAQGWAARLGAELEVMRATPESLEQAIASCAEEPRPATWLAFSAMAARTIHTCELPALVVRAGP